MPLLHNDHHCRQISACNCDGAMQMNHAMSTRSANTTRPLDYPSSADRIESDSEQSDADNQRRFTCPHCLARVRGRTQWTRHKKEYCPSLVQRQPGSQLPTARRQAQDPSITDPLYQHDSEHSGHTSPVIRTRRVAKRYQVNYQEHSTTDEEDVDMDDPAEKELVEDELAGYLDRMQTLHLGDEHQDSDQEQTENERRRRRNATDMRPTADIPPRIRELLNPSPLSFDLPSHSLQTANPRPFSGGINRLIAPFATVRELNMAYYSLVELGMSKPGFKQFLKLVSDPCVIGA
ncbi:hypothetical protein BCR44DRAFT_1430574, partial [Catenaria anguillulae PL171]